MKRSTIVAPALVALLWIQSCSGSNFATQLRTILAASGPLIESLNLGDKKQAVITDMQDLASGAADLSDALKACETKPCKLDAVSKYEVKFWDVLRRGHFKLSPKLEKVQEILGGIISSAKIYYGAPAPRTSRVAGSRPVPEPNAASELNTRLAELKAAMRP